MNTSTNITPLTNTQYQSMINKLTDGSFQLFSDLAEDAGNWSGTPLFGGNVGGDAESKGHLTHLKKIGMLTTFVDEDDRTCAWVEFTTLAKQFLLASGTFTQEEVSYL